jgi:hypothetical protein
MSIKREGQLGALLLERGAGSHDTPFFKALERGK